jgi:hypothetical protein
LDRLDCQAAEIDRLRTRLNGGSPVRALYERWLQEAEHLATKTYKTASGQLEGQARARRIYHHAVQLGRAAGYHDAPQSDLLPWRASMCPQQQGRNTPGAARA